MNVYMYMCVCVMRERGEGGEREGGEREGGREGGREEGAGRGRKGWSEGERESHV